MQQGAVVQRGEITARIQRTGAARPSSGVSFASWVKPNVIVFPVRAEEADGLAGIRVPGMPYHKVGCSAGALRKEVEGYSAYGSLPNMYAASPRITID